MRGSTSSWSPLKHEAVQPGLLHELRTPIRDVGVEAQEVEPTGARMPPSRLCGADQLFGNHLLHERLPVGTAPAEDAVLLRLRETEIRIVRERGARIRTPNVCAEGALVSVRIVVREIEVLRVRGGLAVRQGTGDERGTVGPPSDHLRRRAAPLSSTRCRVAGERHGTPKSADVLLELTHDEVAAVLAQIAIGPREVRLSLTLLGERRTARVNAGFVQVPEQEFARGKAIGLPRSRSKSYRLVAETRLRDPVGKAEVFTPTLERSRGTERRPVRPPHLDEPAGTEVLSVLFDGIRKGRLESAYRASTTWTAFAVAAPEPRRGRARRRYRETSSRDSPSSCRRRTRARKPFDRFVVQTERAEARQR